MAVGLLALIVTTRSLADAERLVSVYRPVSMALVAGAGAAVATGWARPASLLFALGLVMILSVLWFFAVSRFLRAGDWGEPSPHDHDT